MKNSIAFIVILAGALILSVFLPWWIIAPIALCLAYFAKLSPLSGFLVSFAGVFVAWLISIYIIDSDGTVQDILSKLLNVNPMALPYISSLLGALLAGIFGLAGSLLSPKNGA